MLHHERANPALTGRKNRSPGKWRGVFVEHQHIWSKRIEMPMDLRGQARPLAAMPVGNVVQPSIDDGTVVDAAEQQRRAWRQIGVCVLSAEARLAIELAHPSPTGRAVPLVMAPSGEWSTPAERCASRD